MYSVSHNNNITNICKVHTVSIRAESEAPVVARWTGWLVVVV